jgi:hypothetical protein
MPSTNKTPNFGLNQWAGSDRPVRADFNKDNEIIDAELKRLSDLVTAVKHAMYRVGDIIMSVSATNPAGEYGGTWVLWGSGRVPVCVDTTQPEFDTVEKTGGSKNITDVLQHSHSLNVYNIPVGSGDLVAVPMYGGTTPSAGISTSQTGAATVSNLQPYITCYMWKKTA